MKTWDVRVIGARGRVLENTRATGHTKTEAAAYVFLNRGWAKRLQLFDPGTLTPYEFTRADVKEYLRELTERS